MQKGKKMEKYRSFPRAIYKDSSGNKKIVVATDEDVGKDTTVNIVTRG